MIQSYRNVNSGDDRRRNEVAFFNPGDGDSFLIGRLASNITKATAASDSENNWIQPTTFKVKIAKNVALVEDDEDDEVGDEDLGDSDTDDPEEEVDPVAPENKLLSTDEEIVVNNYDITLAMTMPSDVKKRPLVILSKINGEWIHIYIGCLT